MPHIVAAKICHIKYWFNHYFIKYSIPTDFALCGLQVKSAGLVALQDFCSRCLLVIPGVEIEKSEAYIYKCRQFIWFCFLFTKRIYFISCNSRNKSNQTVRIWNSNWSGYTPHLNLERGERARERERERERKRRINYVNEPGEEQMSEV